MTCSSSAAQKQMDQLEADGSGSRRHKSKCPEQPGGSYLLKDSGTKVTGLENLKDAKSIALAGGSVPVGKYTRQALVNLGHSKADGEVDAITTDQVSQALGGVEISEEDNVSKVLTAVAEGSCEVGTTYYSDTYGYEDKLNILQVVSYDLTGDVIYPICQVQKMTKQIRHRLQPQKTSTNSYYLTRLRKSSMHTISTQT